MQAVVVLALGCLIQGPWNTLPVIDCNEGPRLYGAEVRLKDGRKLDGYVALSKPLPTGARRFSLTLYKPDCGLTLFRDPEVRTDDGDVDDDCLFDEYATQHFTRTWLPRERMLDISAPKIKAMRLKPLSWDGISSERFFVLSHAEREVLDKGGPRIPLTDYQGSGRMELAGGPTVTEAQLWELAKPVAAAVQADGRAAVIEQKKALLKKQIVLLFYPDVEP